MSNIGLYFGSFNPIHNGHISIATYFSEYVFDKVWVIISPLSPAKQEKRFIDNALRLQCLNIVFNKVKNCSVSDIEFSLPLPSYTINTLEHITNRYPNNQYTIILGEDNLLMLNKWKEIDCISSLVSFAVYPRLDYKGDFSELIKKGKKIKLYEEAPIIDISSTLIRKLFFKQEYLQLEKYMPVSVLNYLKLQKNKLTL